MTPHPHQIVQKLWSYCNLLRDNWLSYGDYIEQLASRDKANPDLFWLRDESLEDSANLPDLSVIAADVVEDLQAALQHLAPTGEDLAG